jgi:hypothetical protein
MASQAADLARCLARDAEAVCRHYLSNGRRRGCYWVVGDVANTPGRSRRLEESIEQIGLVYTFKARPKAQDIFDAAFLLAANERGVN